jgi:hypothetical protein
MLNDNIEDQIAKEDIYDIHVFKSASNRQQSDSASTAKRDTIIVSLNDVKLKRRFYALGKKMREIGRPIYIGDDLTVGQRALLAKLKQRTDLFNKVQLRDGSVRCLKKDGSWRSFCYLYELKHLPALAIPTITAGTSGWTRYAV